MGRDPTGRVMELDVMGIDVIDISGFEDGKVAEHRDVADGLGTLLQRGFYP